MCAIRLTRPLPVFAASSWLTRWTTRGGWWTVSGIALSVVGTSAAAGLPLRGRFQQAVQRGEHRLPAVVALHAGACGGAHRGTLRRVGQREDGIDEGAFIGGQQQLGAMLDADAAHRVRRGQHELAQRHRFQDFSVTANRAALRRHHQHGMRKPRPQVANRAGHADPRLARQGEHPLRGTWADNVEGERGIGSAQGGQDPESKPFGCVGVAPVVHRAGEHQRPASWREGAAVQDVGREVVGIDAAAN
ncbi:conserved hypothetical protein, partial [Ricinus communis]